MIYIIKPLFSFLFLYRGIRGNLSFFFLTFYPIPHPISPPLLLYIIYLLLFRALFFFLSFLLFSFFLSFLFFPFFFFYVSLPFTPTHLICYFVCLSSISYLNFSLSVDCGLCLIRKCIVWVGGECCRASARAYRAYVRNYPPLRGAENVRFSTFRLNLCGFRDFQGKINIFLIF